MYILVYFCMCPLFPVSWTVCHFVCKWTAVKKPSSLLYMPYQPWNIGHWSLLFSIFCRIFINPIFFYGAFLKGKNRTFTLLESDGRWIRFIIMTGLNVIDSVYFISSDLFSSSVTFAHVRFLLMSSWTSDLFTPPPPRGCTLCDRLQGVQRCSQPMTHS